MAKSETAKRNIVVVGGGGGGVAVATLLAAKIDKLKYTVILVDKRPVGIHLIATARMAVSNVDDFDHQAIRPYDRVFANGGGEYVHGSVTSIEKEGPTGGHVVLENGTRIRYHALILATGSIWEGPANLPDDPEAIQRFFDGSRTAIKNAKNILIAGGGAVGIEIAGEIKDIHPNKNITIVQGGDLLLNDTYPVKFRNAIQNSVEKRGIKVILGEYVDDVPSEGFASVQTRSGKLVTADLVIKSRGPKPNTAFIVSSLGSDTVNQAGFVKVKRTFQLVSHSDIFALGDIVDTPEQKQLAKATMNHAPIVIANVLAYLADKPVTKEYKGAFEAIFVTNGKHGGRAYIPFLWGIVVGDWAVSLIKGKTLFLSMFSKGIGY